MDLCHLGQHRSVLLPALAEESSFLGKRGVQEDDLAPFSLSRHLSFGKGTLKPLVELLGEKEAIGVRQGQQIPYTLVTKVPAPRKREARLAVTLWIDTKTKLPLKRVVAAREKDMEFIVTETYSGLTLGGKVDPKRFELPKE